MAMLLTIYIIVGIGVGALILFVLLYVAAIVQEILLPPNKRLFERASTARKRRKPEWKSTMYIASIDDLDTDAFPVLGDDMFVEDDNIIYFAFDDDGDF